MPQPTGVYQNAGTRPQSFDQLSYLISHRRESITAPQNVAPAFIYALRIAGQMSTYGDGTLPKSVPSVQCCCKPILHALYAGA